MTLTKTRLRGGVWEGTLTGAGATPPVLTLRHEGDIVPGLDLVPGDAGTYAVRVQVPVERVSDDLNTFTITAADETTVLSRFVIFAGEDLHDDLRAEVDLLRAELDLLKRAFRRHCQDTT